MLNATQAEPRLLDQVRDRIRSLHYSIRTEEAYVHWIKAYIKFHGLRHPRDMGQAELEAFMAWLANQRKVAPSTHKQALSSLLFLYRQVLRLEFPWLTEIGRPKAAQRVPVVLSTDEVTALLKSLEPSHKLIGQTLYGTGMRLMEGLRLRIKDVDFSHQAIVVREGKGAKDRVVMLPDKLVGPLRLQLRAVRALWEQDRAADVAGVWTPHALDRKYKDVGKTWGWQWVFPMSNLSVDPRSGERRRHHIQDQSF